MSIQTESAGLVAVSGGLAEQAHAAQQQASQIRELLTLADAGSSAGAAGMKTVPTGRKRSRQR